MVSNAIFIAIISLNSPAYAEIYRVVDKQGNVTYTDQPPTDNQHQITQPIIKSDEEANITDSPEAIADSHPEWLKEARKKRQLEKKEQQEKLAETKFQQRKQWNTDIKLAKTAVAKAEQALIAGNIVSDGDFVGKAGGGARPSVEYLQRVQRLELELKDAKKALKTFKKSLVLKESISDLPKAAAMPASNAAFHCLYLSPKRTTTMSAISMAWRVRIALSFAPLLSCQNLSVSAPMIATPQSSDAS